MQQRFYNPGQTLNAFSLGEQIGTGMRNKETQNAFSQMIGKNDLQGARDYAYDRGALELGQGADSLIADQAEQAKQAQTDQAGEQKEKLTQLRALTENMMSIPEAQRGEFLMSNWQNIEPIVGTDFMTFNQAAGGDYSDASLNEDLAMFRAQLGESPEDQRGATFGTNMHEVIGPDGQPMFVRTDNQGGIHPVDGYTPKPDAKTDMDRVQSTFTDENGNLQLVMRDGTIRSSGMGVQNPFQITDVGGVPTAIDRRTGQGISISTPEEVGSNAATINTVKENEEYRAGVQRDLPQTIENATRSLSAIDGLLNSPGFESRYGVMSVIPAVPGTDMANTQAFIDQIGGQSFLEAFESLKGGGQITEIEGQKATAAITRLGTQGITPSAAREAAEDLRGVIQRGIAKAQAEASGSYSPQGADAPPLVYNPETGDFE